jgi:hypothetical protein
MFVAEPDPVFEITPLTCFADCGPSIDSLGLGMLVVFLAVLMVLGLGLITTWRWWRPLPWIAGALSVGLIILHMAVARLEPPSEIELRVLKLLGDWRVVAAALLTAAIVARSVGRRRY